ncbi:splicing regulatory glutamine/lysine-rich protein 1-like [Drosophila takahashii]|uniref:splicing regulatory glutamine/lysine-rich protein 1-like n=1 Tax=Drosophila takahashii TaxID=29030 RepID=UPI003899351B
MLLLFAPDQKKRKIDEKAEKEKENLDKENLDKENYQVEGVQQVEDSQNIPPMDFEIQEVEQDQEKEEEKKEDEKKKKEDDISRHLYKKRAERELQTGTPVHSGGAHRPKFKKSTEPKMGQGYATFL